MTLRSPRPTKSRLAEDVGEAHAVDAGEFAELGQRGIAQPALDSRQAASICPDVRRDLVQLEPAQRTNRPEALTDFRTGDEVRHELALYQ